MGRGMQEKGKNTQIMIRAEAKVDSSVKSDRKSYRDFQAIFHFARFEFEKFSSFFSFIFVFGGEILTVSAAIFCCKFLVVRFTIFHLLLAGFDFLVFFFLLHTVFFSLLEIIWKISKIGKFVAIFKRRP